MGAGTVRYLAPTLFCATYWAAYEMIAYQNVDEASSVVAEAFKRRAAELTPVLWKHEGGSAPQRKARRYLREAFLTLGHRAAHGSLFAPP